MMPELSETYVLQKVISVRLITSPEKKRLDFKESFGLVANCLYNWESLIVEFGGKI